MATSIVIGVSVVAIYATNKIVKGLWDLGKSIKEIII
jgi:hypothetical protein